MNKLLVFIILLLLLPISSYSQNYISCPDGTLAFSSMEAFDKALIVFRNNDISGMNKLLLSGDIKMLFPGNVVKIQYHQLNLIHRQHFYTNTMLYLLSYSHHF